MGADRNTSLALSLMAIAMGMAMLAYASVPLYSLFCRVTGVGGTTQRATQAPSQISDRIITVRFNTDIDPSLPWTFRPEQRSMRVHIGERSLAFFTASNDGERAVTGTAVYNVTPHAAGLYFNKIQCFCFTRQTLKAHAKARFPVSFFVDPGLLSDPETRDLDTITLSYTFFPVKDR